ncbi:MAG: ATP-binding cassette domain-containing protein [Rickettsiales bacterium]|nr:ATP-binding cassette domain-containing protein [Rickettsiales bacterium]
MENNTAISFANVAAAYDRGREVLSDVSFNIGNGAFYFLSGASGAGKTTLLRLIYQLHMQSRGQIKLFGKSTTGLSRDGVADLRRKMAIVFQEYSLLSHLSVFDNVALPLRVRGMPEAKVKKLVTKFLEWVGLGKYAGADPRSLSGGQQQRVSVARAIIVQPEILLADEPTGNLDDENASRLMELFIQMNKSFGTTIILATHSQKLMDTYKFPRIIIEEHKVKFDQRAAPDEDDADAPAPDAMRSRNSVWKGPKPQSYFSELSKQFDEIGGERNDI